MTATQTNPDPLGPCPGCGRGNGRGHEPGCADDPNGQADLPGQLLLDGSEVEPDTD